MALPSPGKSAGQGIQIVLLWRTITQTQDTNNSILPLRRMRCASSSRGSVAHAPTQGPPRIDGRDHRIMTRHITSTLAPDPPLLARCCWQTSKPSSSSHVIRTFCSAIIHPLLISPRTLDPISFPPLVPTLFRVAKASQIGGISIFAAARVLSPHHAARFQCQNSNRAKLRNTQEAR